MQTRTGTGHIGLLVMVCFCLMLALATTLLPTALAQPSPILSVQQMNPDLTTPGPQPPYTSADLLAMGSRSLMQYTLNIEGTGVAHVVANYAPIDVLSNATLLTEPLQAALDGIAPRRDYPCLTDPEDEESYLFILQTSAISQSVLKFNPKYRSLTLGGAIDGIVNGTTCTTRGDTNALLAYQHHLHRFALYGNAYAKDYDYVFNFYSTAHKIITTTPAVVESINTSDFSLMQLSDCSYAEHCVAKVQFSSADVTSATLYNSVDSVGLTDGQEVYCYDEDNRPVYVLGRKLVSATQLKWDNFTSSTSPTTPTCHAPIPRTAMTPLTRLPMKVEEVIDSNPEGNMGAVVEMIGNNHHMVAHPMMCLEGNPCRFILEFTPTFIQSAPRVMIYTTAPATYSLLDNDYCKLNQFGQYIYLQVIQRTMLIGHDRITCTLVFTAEYFVTAKPSFLSQVWTAENAPVTSFAQMQNRVVPMNVTILDEDKVHDKFNMTLDDYLLHLTTAADTFDTTLYKPYPHYARRGGDGAVIAQFAPFSLVTTRDLPILSLSIPTRDGTCVNIRFCPLTISLNSPLALGRAKMSNFLKLTTPTQEIQCLAENGQVIAILSVDEQLEMLTFTSALDTGLFYHHCNIWIDFSIILPEMDVPVHYEVQHSFYYPHLAHKHPPLLSFDTPGGFDLTTTISDYLHVPQIAPYKFNVLNYMVGSHVHNNYITMSITIGKPNNEDESNYASIHENKYLNVTSAGKTYNYYYDDVKKSTILWEKIVLKFKSNYLSNTHNAKDDGDILFFENTGCRLILETAYISGYTDNSNDADHNLASSCTAVQTEKDTIVLDFTKSLSQQFLRRQYYDAINYIIQFSFGSKLTPPDELVDVHVVYRYDDPSSTIADIEDLSAASTFVLDKQTKSQIKNTVVNRGQVHYPMNFPITVLPKTDMLTQLPQQVYSTAPTGGPRVALSTTYMITNHYTLLRCTFTNIYVGQTLLIQLGYTPAGSAMNYPLRLIVPNVENEVLTLVPWMERVDPPSTCVYCVALKARDTPEAELVATLNNTFGDSIDIKSYVNKFKDIPFHLHLIDTFTNFGGEDLVTFTISLEYFIEDFWPLHHTAATMPVGDAALAPIVSSTRPEHQHIRSLFTIPFKSRVITYNYDLKTPVFTQGGLNVNSAIFMRSGEQPVISVGLQPATRWTDKNHTWSFDFVGCDGWNFVDTDPCVGTTDSTTNTVSVDCVDPTSNPTGFANWFNFVPTKQTMRTQCLFNVHLHITFDAVHDLTQTLTFSNELSFIPAVADHSVAFARDALLCANTDHPVFFLGGGPGVYTIAFHGEFSVESAPPTTAYTWSFDAATHTMKIVIPEQDDDIKLRPTLINTGTTTAMSAHSSSGSSSTSTTRLKAIPVYFKMTCPENSLKDHIYLSTWQWTFTTSTTSTQRGSNAVVASGKAIPRRGYFVHTSLNSLKLNEHFSFEFFPQQDSEIIANPETALPLYGWVYFKTSFAKEHTLRFYSSAGDAYNLLEIQRRAERNDYVYFTHGYDENGAPALLTKKIQVHLEHPNRNNDIVELRLASSVELYDFFQWKSFGSNYTLAITQQHITSPRADIPFPQDVSALFTPYKTITAAAAANIQAGGALSVIPQNVYSGQYTLATCASVSACYPREVMEFNVYNYGTLNFDLNLQYDAIGYTKIQLSRPVNIGDVLRVEVRSPRLRFTAMKHWEYAATSGYFVDISSDEANGLYCIMEVYFEKTFPMKTPFTIPTSFDYDLYHTETIPYTFDNGTIGEITLAESLEVMRPQEIAGLLRSTLTYFHQTRQTPMVIEMNNVGIDLARFKAVTRPMSSFSFHEGFRFNQDVELIMTLGQQLLPGQVLTLGPMPLKPNVNKLFSLVNQNMIYTLELTTSTITFTTLPNGESIPDIFATMLTITSRTDYALFAGTVLQFILPTAQIVEPIATILKKYTTADITLQDFIATKYPIQLHSNGLGVLHYELKGFDLHNSSQSMGFVVDYFDAMNARVAQPTFRAEGGLKPCRAFAELCELNVFFEEFVPSGETIDAKALNVGKFDNLEVVLNFDTLNVHVKHLVDTTYQLNADPTYFPTQYHGKSMDLFAGHYTATTTYTTTNQMVITLQRTPLAVPGRVYDLPTLPIYVNFTAPQYYGSLQVAVSTTNVAGGRAPILTTFVKGPTVVSDDRLAPYFYYMDGGFFIGETMRGIGFVPSASLIPPATEGSAEIDLAEPRPHTVVMKFTIDPNIDDNTNNKMTTIFREQLRSRLYDEIFRDNVFNLELETVSNFHLLQSMRDYSTQFYLQTTDTEMTFITTLTNIPITNTDAITIRFANFLTTTIRIESEVEFRSGFTVETYAQAFDPKLYLEKFADGTLDRTQPLPPLTQQLLEVNLVQQTPQKIPGFAIKPKPWIRVVPEIIHPMERSSVLNAAGRYTPYEPRTAAIPVDTDGLLLSLDIQLNLPAPYSFTPTDVILLKLPPYYTITPNTYTCTSPCVDNVNNTCTTQLIYTGLQFVLQFDSQFSTVATSYLCEIPVRVSNVDFQSYLATHNLASPNPEVTLSQVDFHEDIADAPTPDHLPAANSWALYNPQVDGTTTIRQKFLQFYAPMPIQRAVYKVEFEDMLYHYQPGLMRFEFTDTSILAQNDGFANHLFFALPFNVLTETNVACVDETSNKVIGTIRTSTDNYGISHVYFMVQESPKTSSHLTCASTITPTSSYAHYYKGTTTNLIISSNIAGTSTTLLYDTIQCSFTTSRPDFKQNQMLREPRPTLSLTGTIIEGLTNQLTFTGEEMRVQPGDVLTVSLPFRFKPTHGDWANTHCVTQGSTAVARVTFLFDLTPFAVDPARPQFDTNTHNTEQVANGVRLTFPTTSPMIDLVVWRCFIDVQAVQYQGSMVTTRLSSVSHTTNTTLDRTTSRYSTANLSYNIVNKLKLEYLFTVDLGLTMANQISQSEPTITMYFNTTEFSLYPDSSPAISLLVPFEFTSTSVNGVSCYLSDTSLDHIIVPFEQLITSTTLSHYSIPIGRYLTSATHTLAYVQCVFSRTTTSTMAQVDQLTNQQAAKLQVGSVNQHTFFSHPFSIPHVPTFSFSTIDTAQDVTITNPLVKEWTEMDDLNMLNTTHFVQMSNQAPLTLRFDSLTNVAIGDSLRYYGNDDVYALFPVDTHGCMNEVTGEVLFVHNPDDDTYLAPLDMSAGQREKGLDKVFTCEQHMFTRFTAFDPFINQTDKSTLAAQFDPPGCGTTLDHYCHHVTTMSVQINTHITTWFAHLEFNAQISAGPIPIHNTFQQLQVYNLNFTGLYEGSVIIVDFDETYLSFSHSAAVITSHLPSVDYLQCDPTTPSGPNKKTIKCALTTNVVPFWDVSVLSVSYKISNLTAAYHAMAEPPADVVPFVVTFQQAAVFQNAPTLPPYSFSVPTSNLTKTTRPFLNQLLEVSPTFFTPFLEKIANSPSYMLIPPRFLALMTNATNIVESNDVGGVNIEFGLELFLLPQSFKSFTIPLGTFVGVDSALLTAGAARDLNGNLLQTKNFAAPITSLMSSPYWSTAVDRDPVIFKFATTLITFCANNNFDPSRPLFQLEISLIRNNGTDGVYDETTQFTASALVTPLEDNIAAYNAFLDQTSAHTISCQFPITLTRPAFDFLPPSVGVDDSMPINMDASSSYEVQLSTQTMEYADELKCITGANSTIPIYGLTVHQKFSNKYYSTAKTAISVDDGALTVGTLGSINITIDQPVLQEGDVYVFTFIPNTFDEALLDKYELAATTNKKKQSRRDVDLDLIDYVYTGTDGFNDRVITGTGVNLINVTSLWSQGYRFSSPQDYVGIEGQQVNTGCYNLFYPHVQTTNNVYRVGEIVGLDQNLQPRPGKPSHIFRLTVTAAPRHGSSFIFSQFSCQAKLMSFTTNPFDGVIKGKFFSKAEYQQYVEEYQKNVQHAITPSEYTSYKTEHANLALQSLNTTVGKVESPVSTSLDFRMTMTEITEPNQPVNMTFTLSAAPTQREILLVVNLTQFYFKSFAGCVGDYALADFYPTSQFLNPIHYDILRVYIPVVEEMPSTITCSFMSSAIVHSSYFATLSNVTGTLTQEQIDARGKLPIFIKAYRLLNRDFVNNNKYLTPTQREKLIDFFAPRTIEEMPGISYWKLQTLVDTTYHHRGLYILPGYYNLLSLVIHNRPYININPYLSETELTAVRKSVVGLIGLHIGGGLFQRFEEHDIIILGQTWTAAQHTLTLTFYLDSYTTQLDLRTSTLAALGFDNVGSWVDAFQQQTGHLIVDPDTPPGQSILDNLDFPPIVMDGVPVGTSTVAKAFDMTAFLAINSVYYQECLIFQRRVTRGLIDDTLPYTSTALGRCTPAPNGTPCNRNAQCQSALCVVTAGALNPKSPRSIQYGNPGYLGTCANEIVLPVSEQSQAMINSMVSHHLGANAPTTITPYGSSEVTSSRSDVEVYQDYLQWELIQRRVAQDEINLPEQLTPHHATPNQLMHQFRTMDQYASYILYTTAQQETLLPAINLRNHLPQSSSSDEALDITISETINTMQASSSSSSSLFFPTLSLLMIIISTTIALL